MAMTTEHQQTFSKTCAQRTVLSKTADNGLKGIHQYITEEQFELLLNKMQRRKFVKGSYLLWEGDAADKLYYIISGQVKLTKSTEEGKDLIISVLHKGDLIAEFNGFHDAQYTYNAETMSGAEIGVILKKDMAELLAQHGDLALQFMYWMGQNNRIMESKLRDLLLHGKTGALASTLIRMGNTYGVKGIDGSIHIQLKMTNTELGEMIACTRESVNRMLSDWKNDGTLDMEDGKLIIRDINNLRDICKCPSVAACPLQICRL